MNSLVPCYKPCLHTLSNIHSLIKNQITKSKTRENGREEKILFSQVTQTREVTPLSNPFPCNLCYMGINPIYCGQSTIVSTNG